jgi:phosphate transport system ATP-binding protein
MLKLSQRTSSNSQTASVVQMASELNSVKMSVRDLDFYYRDYRALKGISVDIMEKKVTAIIMDWVFRTSS